MKRWLVFRLGVMKFQFFYFALDTLRTEHFEGLKHISSSQRSAQSCNADRSHTAIASDPLDINFIGRYRRQSSAKRRTCEETVAARGTSLYSEGSIVRRLLFSKGSMVRRFNSPKVRSSEKKKF